MTITASLLRRSLILLALGLVTACGFKLRSEMVLPPELAVMRVQVSDEYSPLKANLEQALKRAGAREPNAREQAAILRISKNRMSRWPLSVGRTGRVQEYSMRYEVVMQLSDASGAIVVPRQEIQLERSYQFETVRAQGTPGEEEVVRAELERDMAQAILRRIDAVLAGR